MTTPLHFCVSENRTSDEIGIKLLVLGLVKHEPDCVIHLFIDDLSDELKTWLKQYPQAVEEHLSIGPSEGWNIKARLLLKLLDDGVKAPIWIDSDIIVTAPVKRYFNDLDDETLLTAEEFFTISNRGSTLRTVGWGLPFGRELNFTPNNCIMRVTNFHRDFLTGWHTLLQRPDYLAYQKMDSSKRPIYMMGGQQVMTALLGSADFTHVPVQYLKRGEDIAQCFKADGYSPLQRIKNWRRLPPFVHAQLTKPWRPENKFFYLEVDAFRYAAGEYISELTPEESRWYYERSVPASFMHCLFLGHPSFTGLPTSIGASTWKYSKALLRYFQKPFTRSAPSS